MAPPRAALAQSESKARFFERLGLDEQNEQHRRLYAMMKEEAVEGRRRMTATAESLAPQFRDDPTVEPPYSSSQISETAIHREILRIYAMARRETKPVYDLGRDTAGIEEENWVIRWMLWHVFRYRDNRNKNRRTASPGDEADSGGGISPDGGSGGSGNGQGSLSGEVETLTKLSNFHSIDRNPSTIAVLGPCPQWVDKSINAAHTRHPRPSCRSSNAKWNAKSDADPSSLASTSTPLSG